MTRLFVYLFQLSGRTLMLCVSMSVFAAVLNVALVSLLLNFFRSQTSSGHSYHWYWLYCVALLIARSLSEASLFRLILNNLYQLRVRLARQIAGMTQRAIEILGSVAILSAIVNDIGVIANVGSTFPSLIMSICGAVGLLGYLLFVSPYVFLFVLFALMAAIAVYLALTNSSMRFFYLSRDAEEQVVADVTLLLEASKELRLNSARHSRVLEDLERHAAECRRAGHWALKRYTLGSSWANTAYFVIMGLLLLLPSAPAAHRLGIDQQSSLTAVIAILFMRGTVETIVGLLPNMRQATVAVERVQAINTGLNVAVRPLGISARDGRFFDVIRVSEIGYLYEAPDGQVPFRVGPVTLEIRRGETIFFAGGNGSGKTSLLKMLCGLYRPNQGTIYLDGTPVDRDSESIYREMFSAVFQDFRLQKSIPFANDLQKRRAEALLEEFDLASEVMVNSAGFAYTELSRGQQKRLALVIVLLEDKPVCLLDEWAADQDPAFREYFYLRLLPRLKAEGKTVLAVTHDDRYYHASDRVYMLCEGLVTKVIACCDDPDFRVATAG
jgi:putative pyoverdin transport system ATP-binding/permease protein